MHLKQIIDESFGDFMECAMLLVTPYCNFKCVDCQNKHLLQLETKNFPDEEILERFFKNPLTSAIIFGGLEPLDSILEVRKFIHLLGCKVYAEELEKPTVVIYTGYELREIDSDLYWSGLGPEMHQYNKCILKYGRYAPEYDKDGKRIDIWNEDLGVFLASPNQNTIKYMQ